MQKRNLMRFPKKLISISIQFVGLLAILLSSCRHTPTSMEDRFNYINGHNTTIHSLPQSFLSRYSGAVATPAKTDTITNFELFTDTSTTKFSKLSPWPQAALSDSLFVIMKHLDIENKKLSLSFDHAGYLLFSKSVEISNCSFLPDRSANKYGNVGYLSDCTFDSSLTLFQSEYKANLKFSNCIFNSPITISNPSFRPASSWESVLWLNCSFAYCYFEDGISFNDKAIPESHMTDKQIKGSRFNHDLFFYNCRIGKKLDLSECRFDSMSHLILYTSILPDTLDLTNAKLTGTIDLTNAKLGDQDSPCQINLIGTDIDKIKIQYGNFHLYIPDSIKTDKYSKDIVSATYEALLNNFQKNGYRDSYKKLNIEYKDWQASNNWLLWVSKAWWQYGLDKWYILFWTVGFMIVFSYINARVYTRIFATFTIPELNEAKYSFSNNRFLKKLQKFWLSVMYTGFIFFKISIDFKKIKIVDWGFLILLFVEYLIGLLCTAYIINWILGK